MFYNDAIIVIKWIVKFSLEIKTADSFETYLSKQRSLNALLYRYKYPIGIDVRLFYPDLYLIVVPVWKLKYVKRQ